MKKILVFLLSLLLLVSVNAQENNIEENLIETFLENNKNFHNHLKEKFSLHTNKTVYFSGEKIWFKGYVVKDIDNKLYKKTTNLYVKLLSLKGDVIKSNLLFVEEGVTNGEIKIPDDLPDGQYYIQLNTSWNLNFDKNGYTSVIEIINLNNKGQLEKKETKQNKENPDAQKLKIQFFPEGGTLLKNTFNKVFFKITKGNKPVITDGFIIDDLIDEKIEKFNSNILGIGSFKIYIRENQSKSIELNYQEEKYHFNLPKANDNGIILEKAVDADNPKVVNLKIKTNTKTLKKYKGKNIFAVLQRNGFVKSVIPILLEENFYSYLVRYGSEVLFDGVNTVTIFNSENDILSEESFYFKKEETIKIETSVLKETKDSLFLDLKLKNNYTKVNSSISVLPSETKVYNNKRNILTDFLISPYLNNIQLNEALFFDKKDPLKDINMILKTLPISIKGYKLQSVNKMEPFEQGVTISGKVNNVLKENETYKVLLSSQENSLLLTKKLEKDGSFEFSNLYLLHPSSYQLSLLNNKGEVIPSNFYIFKNQQAKFYLNKNIEEIKFNNTTKSSLKGLDKNLERQIYDEKSLNFNNKNYESLNEVIVTGKITKEDDYLPQKRTIAGEFVKEHKINKIMLTPFNSIADIIHTLPGIVFVQPTPLPGGLSTKKAVVFNGRGPNTFFGDIQALVILNGSILTDHSVLEDISASELDGRINVNKAGAGYGFRGSNGVLIINTINPKTLSSKKVNKKEVNKEKYNTDFGFSKASINYEKELMTYINYVSEKKYSAIDWIPNFNLLPNKSNILRVKKTNNEIIKLVVNGVSNEGRLIFDTIDITVPKLK
ncbi:Plug domain-containing protein [Tenacibaculum sp. IB213877]|uniref:Plug domain-containing protein n=1 Tax=Tenacibaculum sp. IB213877 TaxID=3097351 RepID=UPI002A5A5B5F|nr:Plug domain-containing protein [Tenacibaculum sp. IB213877]MDY0779722.1 Plug domain-containing protein [Tenacibaculum sp. IB213877]